MFNTILSLHQLSKQYYSWSLKQDHDKIQIQMQK